MNYDRSKAQSKQELISLLEKIEESIRVHAEYGKNELERADLDLAQELSKLKYYKKKIQMRLDEISEWDDNEWLRERNSLQNDIREIKKAWSQTSSVLSDREP
jgi:hypothetical protein